MSIQIIKTKDEFCGLREVWNQLLSRSDSDTIFLTWEWLSSWWEAYTGPTDDLHIIVVRDQGGQITGIAPFFLTKQRWLPFFGMKTLRFVGDGSWDSDYLDMILAKEHEEESLRSIWDYLRSNNRLWDIVEFPPVSEQSSMLRWLKNLGSQGELMLRNEYVPCSVTHLPRSWDEYMTALSPRFRTKIRSTLRNLQESHDIRFYSIENDNDLTAGLETLFRLHSKRWKLKEHDGVFVNPTKRRFYYSFAPEFLKRGWLAFDFLDIDGRTVACQLCFRYNGTQFLLQEGFDPEFGAESVGIALRAMVFRKAICDGIHSYDFLAGVGRQKAQWGAQVKGCVKGLAARPTLQNAVYMKTPILIEAVKQRAKAVLPRKAVELRRRLLTS
ncbi:MAG: hypothetical protein DMG16_05240 [Acidobacteria bacterium]|nr:MAG: hypothetical protein DMG16_05240 [Acidobacteriota bacterium]